MATKNEAVNLFDTEALDASADLISKKSTKNDGLYRPSPKDAKDKQKGYVATLRFLPNLLEEGKFGSTAIEKHVHYANLPDYTDLQGYYDSLINFGEKCPLTTLYWTLKNSKNEAQKEKAPLIGRTTKYYSYVLIIEDEQHPELIGKILIFPYGFKIQEKIDLEKTGEGDGKRCNIFDPANGKDFRLIVKQKGEWPNYDASSFRPASPMKVWDEKKEKFIQIPVVFNETKQKNEITDVNVQKKLAEFLLTRTHKLEDNAPKRWTDEEKVKVNRIIELLNGKVSYSTPISKKDTELDKEMGEEEDDLDFNKHFNLDTDDEN